MLTLKISRIPFYAYIRLLFLLYLILPQTQGARIIYQEHIHPFLSENETQIEDFIASAHDRLKAAGIAYLKRAIELLKTNVLGMPPDEHPPAPEPESPQSYTQSLLARFSLPAARWTGTGNTGADFYNLLASAVTAATGAAGAGGTQGAGRTGQADLSASGTLIPPSLRGTSEKMTFIAAQRERLNIVISALDREAKELERQQAIPKPRVTSMALDGGEETVERPASGLSAFSAMSGLSKSRSEADFEKIEAESGAEDEGTVRRRGGTTPGAAGGAGSWLPWGWGGAQTPTVEQSQGRSSGVEK
jgi:receptor expression-enhancing protein 1/2/3/4